MLKQTLKRKILLSPRPEHREIIQQSDLEHSYYQHQAFIALHSAGIHIHFKDQDQED